MKPIVAIIGRPNVGKSTLFNRIIGSRKALTLATPGVTRDRNFALAEWGGREFLCVDTGGFPIDEGDIVEEVESQIDLAIDESDAILCVLDGQAGLVPEEAKIVHRMRQVKKPVYYVVNKIDQPDQEANIADFYRLGVQHLHPVSGEHGYQVAELLDDLVQNFPREFEEAPLEGNKIQIAVVGRPNVGKSSLVNSLLGRPRVVVDHSPGTTRDSIDTAFQVNSQSYLLIDTAGIRRRSQKGGFLERLIVMQSFRTIDRADICVLLLAADYGISKQDAHIAGYIIERGKGLIVVWNKMDLSQAKDENDLQESTDHSLSFLPQVPRQFISVKLGRGIDNLLPEVNQLYQELGKRVATSKLNSVFSEIVENHPTPLFKGREVKFKYATQGGTHPPTFIVFSNIPEGIPDSYRRYMIHGLQAKLGLQRVPVRLVFKKKR